MSKVKIKTKYTNGVYIKWVDSRIVGGCWEFIDEIKDKEL